METIVLLTQNTTKKTIPKGTILQRKGDKKIRAFFVTKGLLRSYAIDDSGKEHIFMFAPENWLITDVELLSNHTEATLFIDTLEDSEIEIIDERIFNKINELPTGLLCSQITKLINRINILQKRVLLLMSASAEERYKDFIATYPDIVQRVPQKMIASYLGITPQALSTIRNKKIR